MTTKYFPFYIYFTSTASICDFNVFPLRIKTKLLSFFLRKNKQTNNIYIYILYIYTHIHIHLWYNYFLPACGSFFNFLDGGLEWKTYFFFLKSTLSFFSVIVYTIVIILKKLLPNQRS